MTDAGSQTHRRIRKGGPAPDDQERAEWSRDYSSTRHGDQDLLFSEGDLDDSIQALAAGDEAEAGTNLVYGAVHQFDGEEVGSAIAARPCLGPSRDDQDAIEQIIHESARQPLEQGWRRRPQRRDDSPDRPVAGRRLLLRRLRRLDIGRDRYREQLLVRHARLRLGWRRRRQRRR